MEAVFTENQNEAAIDTASEAAPKESFVNRRNWRSTNTGLGAEKSAELISWLSSKYLESCFNLIRK